MHGETRRGTREYIGARIRRFRTEQGLSLRDLSDLSDVPEFTIGAIEGGHKMARLEHILHLARALGVPVVEFFSDDEDDG